MSGPGSELGMVELHNGTSVYEGFLNVAYGILHDLMTSTNETHRNAALKLAVSVKTEQPITDQAAVSLLRQLKIIREDGTIHEDTCHVVDACFELKGLNVNFRDPRRK